MGIRGRLLILTLGVAIPLAAVGLAAVDEVWKSGRRQLEESLKQRAELGAVALDRWLEAQREPLATLATFYVRRGSRAGALREDLEVVSARRRWIDLRVVNAQGAVEAAYPVESGRLGPGMVMDVLVDISRRGDWVLVSDRESDGGGGASLAIGEPVGGGGAVIGRVHASDVRDLFRDIELPDGAVIAVFDAHGRLLYRSTSPESFAETEAGGSSLLAALEGRRTAVAEAWSPYDGVRRVYGMARAGESGVMLLVGEPSEMLYAPARGQLLRLAGFSAGALLLAVGAAFFVAGGIATPLGRLKATARRFGAGDLEARASTTGVVEMDEVGTAFNQMAAEIQERERRLGELDRLRSEFVSGVSHELRTPLTTIKTLAYVMLRNGGGGAERRGHLETIAAECDRQIDFVLNLFDLSRIEAGSLKITEERVDVAEVARACLLGEEEKAAARGQELSMDVPPGLPAVAADYGGLRRALCALVDNAVKYTPDGGRITLSARREGELVALSVADTGPGIAPGDLPHIFEKFYRGRPAGDGAGRAEVDADFFGVPGTGLGLYLAQKIIEQMGGSIAVETAAGGGSTFTVRLRAWPQDGG